MLQKKTENCVLHDKIERNSLFFNLKDTKVKEKIQKVLLSSYLKPVLRLDQPPSYFF